MFPLAKAWVAVPQTLSYFFHQSFVSSQIDFFSSSYTHNRQHTHVSHFTKQVSGGVIQKYISDFSVQFVDLTFSPGAIRVQQQEEVRGLIQVRQGVLRAHYNPHQAAGNCCHAH
jgi:hypothetical protein